MKRVLRRCYSMSILKEFQFYFLKYFKYVHKLLIYILNFFEMKNETDILIKSVTKYNPQQEYINIKT